jgi:hypothetical protein
MDAEDGDVGASTRLRSVLADARQRHDPEIEVLALDALARARAVGDHITAAQELLERADRLMPSARHLISDADRIDATRARALLPSMTASR